MSVGVLHVLFSKHYCPKTSIRPQPLPHPPPTFFLCAAFRKRGRKKKKQRETPEKWKKKEMRRWESVPSIRSRCSRLSRSLSSLLVVLVVVIVVVAVVVVTVIRQWKPFDVQNRGYPLSNLFLGVVVPRRGLSRVEQNTGLYVGTQRVTESI